MDLLSSKASPPLLLLLLLDLLMLLLLLLLLSDAFDSPTPSNGALSAPAGDDRVRVKIG